MNECSKEGPAKKSGHPEEEVGIALGGNASLDGRRRAAVQAEPAHGRRGALRTCAVNARQGSGGTALFGLRSVTGFSVRDVRRVKEPHIGDAGPRTRL
jgi:hypothetical protein